MNTDLRPLLIAEIDRIKRAMAVNANAVAGLELLVSELDAQASPGDVNGVKALLTAITAESNSATSAADAQALLDAIAQEGDLPSLAPFVVKMRESLVSDAVLRKAVLDAASYVVTSPTVDEF